MDEKQSNNRFMCNSTSIVHADLSQRLQQIDTTIKKMVLPSRIPYLFQKKKGVSSKWTVIIFSLLAALAVIASSSFAWQAQSGSTIYYVRTDGNDNCSGTVNDPDALPGSEACAFKTVAQALATVQPGGVISIMPGVYREPIIPNTSGTEAEPITIKAENGPNTVYFYASESTQGKMWNNYTTYSQSGRSLNLQAHVDTNNIRFIELDWCYAQDPRSLTIDFYERCTEVPADKIAIPFETDLVALVLNEGTPERSVTRLPKAHEPNWTVDEAWKVSENWWKADSGARSLDDGNASPRTTSQRFLKDTMDDHTLDEDLDGQPDFPGIPPGNIRDIFDQNDFSDPRETLAPSPRDALPQLAHMPKKVSLGATIIFNDTKDGHYTNNLFIKDYNAQTGIIEIQDIYNPEGYEKLGYLTKFYIEGTPKAMDCPGEWVHHDGKLFILLGTGCGRTVTENDLQHLEIAKQFMLLRLASISHITFQNINFAFGNSNRYGASLYIDAWEGGPPRYIGSPTTLLSVSADSSVNSGAAANVVLDGIVVEDSMTGLSFVGLAQTRQPGTFTLRNSTFQNIDDRALDFENRGRINSLVIENNVFRNLAFRSLRGEADGIHIKQVSNIIFRNNLIQNIGHNGVQIFQGSGNFVADNILIAGNTFDGACQMATDCAGLKLHGGGKSYGDVLVIDNVSKNNLGWTYARWRRDLARSNPEVGEEVSWNFSQLGLMGNGYYLDFASGVTFYGNFAIHNGRAGIYMYPTYRDGKIHIFYNTIHDALNGIYFYPGHQLSFQAGSRNHRLDHTDTRVVGNIISGYENSGIYISCSQSDQIQDDNRNLSTPIRLSKQNVIIDHNIFKEFATNPNPDPYWWYDPASYNPIDVQYHACDDKLHNYESVEALQENTPWQAHGLDWKPTEPLYVNENGNNKEDYLIADKEKAAAVIGTFVPAEVAGLMSSLKSELGVSIDPPTQLLNLIGSKTPSVTSKPTVETSEEPAVAPFLTATPITQLTVPADPGDDLNSGGPLSQIPLLKRLAGRPVLQTVVIVFAGVFLLIVIGVLVRLFHPTR